MFEVLFDKFPISTKLGKELLFSQLLENGLDNLKYDLKVKVRIEIKEIKDGQVTLGFSFLGIEPEKYKDVKLAYLEDLDFCKGHTVTFMDLSFESSWKISDSID